MQHTRIFAARLTIVFCVDVEHAARMRQALINENVDLFQQNILYIMRITGDDPEGCDQLGNFIDPEATYPVIVTPHGCSPPGSMPRPAASSSLTVKSAR